MFQSAHAQRDVGGQFAGGDGAGGGNREVTVRPLAGTGARGRARRRGRPAGRGTAGRPEGTGRARDAGGSGCERRGPRREVRQRRDFRHHARGGRYSHVMHIVSNWWATFGLSRRIRRPALLRAGRDGLRRAEGAGHADHRPVRAEKRGPYGGAVGSSTIQR